MPPAIPFPAFARAKSRSIASLRSRGRHSPALTIGIRREDPLRVWERRCPLTPDAVKFLVEEQNVNVLVQPCERRIYPMNDFIKVCTTLFFPFVPMVRINGHRNFPSRLVPVHIRRYPLPT